MNLWESWPVSHGIESQWLVRFNPTQRNPVELTNTCKELRAVFHPATRPASLPVSERR